MNEFSIRRDNGIKEIVGTLEIYLHREEEDTEWVEMKPIEEKSVWEKKVYEHKVNKCLFNKCSVCGMTGHKKPTCPKQYKIVSRKSRTMSCSKCGGKNHNCRSCKKHKCSYCGKYGHSIRKHKNNGEDGYVVKPKVRSDEVY